MESFEHRLDMIWLTFVKHHTHCCVGEFNSYEAHKSGSWETSQQCFSYDDDDCYEGESVWYDDMCLKADYV